MHPQPAFSLILDLILPQLAISLAQDQPAPDPLIPLIESKKSEELSLQVPRVTTVAAQLAADMVGCTASSTTVQQIQQGGRETDTTIVL